MHLRPATWICGPPRNFVMRLLPLSIVVLGLITLATDARAQWVQFVDQTSTRLVASPDRGTNDLEEKRYEWGDVDHDGDIDLIVMRKQGWTTPGKRTDVLFINMNGVLTDRTNDFGLGSDVVGDQGMMTPTNTRDSVLVDVDNDGWLDLVTAPTISPGDPKFIGHPRVYMNKGCTGACNGTADWLGFRFENARIPALLTDNLQSGFNPCFCHVSAGDVTGDGYADLWFMDYDSGCSADFNDKLLINRGAAQPGFFDDKTETSFSGPFNVAAFGAASAVLDMNGDSKLDLVKENQGPVELAFNNPMGTGFFSSTSVPYSGSAYFVSVGDLNKDNKLDMVISDDGADRYLLNQGNGTDDKADFLSFVYSYTGGASDDGFSGDSIVADLNSDGWNDVLMTDVDVDAGGCDRRMHIFKNNGGSVGGNVQLQELTSGTNCQNFQGYPASCLVASIPSNKLKGVHDVAVFDINGDGMKDLVVGRCNSTEVYINVTAPPVPPAGSVSGDGISGAALLLNKGLLGPGSVTLTWGASCASSDTDYSVYEGTLGAFGTANPASCTTGGALTHTYLPSEGDRFFLIVPNNGTFEGDFGTQSDGTTPRHPASTCRPINAVNCD